ncbi:MAG: hypothetical protein P1P59_11130 [Treponemataceae bacterium]
MYIREIEHITPTKLFPLAVFAKKHACGKAVFILPLPFDKFLFI